MDPDYVPDDDFDDDDFEDVGAPRSEEEACVERGSAINPAGKVVRGKDIVWCDVEQFENVDAFKNSEVFKDLKENFSLRRSREPEYADTEHYTCKYSRKVGFLCCPLQYKVSYLSTCDTVIVQSPQGCATHKHEEDPDFVWEGKNFRWTTQQTNIVFLGVKNEAKPRVILRNLREANVFVEGKEPTSLQLNNKIRHCRKILQHSSQIFSTHELRQKVCEKLDVPESDVEGYVAHYKIDDEDDEKEPRFTIIWSTKKLLARASSSFHQDDATYRLIWQVRFN